MDAISLAISRSGGCSLNAHRRWFPAKRALLSVPAAPVDHHSFENCSNSARISAPFATTILFPATGSPQVPILDQAQIHSDDSNRCDIIGIIILTVIFSAYYTILFCIQQSDTRKLNYYQRQYVVLSKRPHAARDLGSLHRYLGE